MRLRIRKKIQKVPRCSGDIMKLITSEDPSTGDRILSLRITQDDLACAEITNVERKILNFCEEDGAMSSRILAVAVLARRIEKSHFKKKEEKNAKLVRPN